MIIFTECEYIIFVGIKRHGWSKLETQAMRDAFKVPLSTGCNVGGVAIKQSQEEYPILRERSLAIIRTKINNIIKRKEKFTL